MGSSLVVYGRRQADLALAALVPTRIVKRNPKKANKVNYLGTKILVDVDLKLSGMMKIPKLLDKSKLAKNYSNLLDDLAKLCEKSV